MEERMTTLETVAPESSAPKDKPVRVALIGCGSAGRYNLGRILAAPQPTEVRVVSEPSPKAYAEAVKVFTAAKRPAPINEPNLERLLTEYRGQLDAAFIATPHVYHHGQAKACLEAGLDVLLEKPMVMNAQEARSLIETVERTGRLLVVAFNGSLSPHVRAAARLLRSGELGQILSINATIWQNWGEVTENTWRQQPKLSGGGFLFDTGAHMLNTVADLAGEDFVEVAAWLTNRGRPVETLAVVMARLASGAFVTLNGCGETVPSCDSDILAYCTDGIIRTGAWGRKLEVWRRDSGTFEPVDVPPSSGVWEQFVAVRSGHLPNPCPPEVGLRMARLWDAIQASAAQGGKIVRAI
jgi:predicted dehydrogenase